MTSLCPVQYLSQSCCSTSDQLYIYIYILYMYIYLTFSLQRFVALPKIHIYPPFDIWHHFSCTGGLEHGACARLPPSLFGWALRILLHGDWSVSVQLVAIRGHLSASEIQDILDQTTSPAAVSLLILFLRKQKTRVSFINSGVISINVYMCQPTLPSIL